MRVDLERDAYYMPSADRVLANSVLLDYLSRAAGADVGPLFREWGFHVVDIHRTGQPFVADCGDDREDHLTRRGRSARSSWEGEGSGRRAQGEPFVYAFPVHPEAREVEVRLLARGSFALEAASRRLGEWSIEEGREVACRLDDREAWPGNRLTVRIVPREGEPQADVAWIRVAVSR
jgi:hypothetical protein